MNTQARPRVWIVTFLFLLSVVPQSAALGVEHHLWLLDEGQGDVAVDSGSIGYDMQVVAPEWRDDGPFPGAGSLHLDGSGKTYGWLERRIGGGSGTLEMWIKPKRITGSQVLFGTCFTSTSRLHLYLTNGDLLLSDEWWSSRRTVIAPGAFAETDADQWAHVAITWGEPGHRIYKNGKLLTEKTPGASFHTLADRAAIGIHAWNRKGDPFHGQIAQVRLSQTQLSPGEGSGKGELAWNASLRPLRILRPSLQWMPGPRGSNMFARQEQRVMTLRVTNRFLEPMDPMTISVSLRDQFEDQKLPPLEVKLDKPLAQRETRDVPVDLGITRAGLYDLVATGPLESQAQSHVTWIRGPQPADYTADVPFFGSCSHATNYEWGFPMRREIGSRLERSILHWHEQQAAGDFSFRPPGHPLYEVIGPSGGEAYAYSGYTPAFASPKPKGQKHIYDVPDLRHYATWMEQGAAHFRGTIRFWEIWNEPNGAGCFFYGTAEELADLHKAGHLAMKGVDPKLQTVGASTVSIDTEYMDRLYDAGAVDYMDKIAFHLYRWDYPPEPGMIGALKGMIAWRDKHAPNRPLWDNEWGYSIKDHGPKRHAQLTARHLIITKALGIEHSDIYTFRGTASHLLFNEKTPKPAAIAYRTVAQRLTNAPPVAVVSEGTDDVFAYVFDRKGVLVLVAWTTVKKPKSLKGIPIDPTKAALFDLMGNPLPLAPADGRCELALSQSPVFLDGVRPAYIEQAERIAPLPDGAPPVRHPTLWYSFHYPKGSEVVGLPQGATRTITLRVHNDGDEPVTGRLNLRSAAELRVDAEQIPVAVEANSSAEVSFQTSAPPDLEEGVYRVNLTSDADGLSFGNMSIRCYVAAGEVQMFHMATWEMAQRLVEEKGYGQGIHIRWISPGGYLTFKYDLTGVKTARLWGYMDSVSPSEIDGGNFRVSASTDKEHWDILLEGTGPFAWRDVDLTPYVGKQVFVRFSNPTDKGEARVKQWRLVTTPATGTSAK